MCADECIGCASAKCMIGMNILTRAACAGQEASRSMTDTDATCIQLDCMRRGARIGFDGSIAGNVTRLACCKQVPSGFRAWHSIEAGCMFASMQ